MATKKLSDYKGAIGQITKVNSTTMVENLNAQMLAGKYISNIPHVVENNPDIAGNIIALITDDTKGAATRGVILSIAGLDSRYGFQLQAGYHSKYEGLHYRRMAPENDGGIGLWFKIATESWVENTFAKKTASLVTLDDLKEVLTTEQISKLTTAVQKRIAVIDKNQSLNTNNMDNNNLQMGGGWIKNSTLANALRSCLSAQERRAA